MGYYRQALGTAFMPYAVDKVYTYTSEIRNNKFITKHYETVSKVVRYLGIGTYINWPDKMCMSLGAPYR